MSHMASSVSPSVSDASTKLLKHVTMTAMTSGLSDRTSDWKKRTFMSNSGKQNKFNVTQIVS